MFDFAVTSRSCLTSESDGADEVPNQRHCAEESALVSDPPVTSHIVDGTKSFSLTIRPTL